MKVIKVDRLSFQITTYPDEGNGNPAMDIHVFWWIFRFYHTSQ